MSFEQKRRERLAETWQTKGKADIWFGKYIVENAATWNGDIN